MFYRHIAEVMHNTIVIRLLIQHVSSYGVSTINRGTKISKQRHVLNDPVYRLSMYIHHVYLSR